MMFFSSSAISKHNHHSTGHKERMLKTFLFSQWLFDEPDWDLRKAGQKHNLPRLVMERGGGGEKEHEML